MNLIHGTGAVDGDVCLHLPHELQGLGDGEPFGLQEFALYIWW